jgi:phenylpyruvate tautomerase PptA (4-oxalocrotonate tautomerase family)
MPILSVEIVGERQQDDLAARIADSVADVLESPPGTVWVKLYALPIESYAENGGPMPLDLRPVFVTMLAADPPDPPDLAERARLLTTAIGDAIGTVPQHVHILFEPSAQGRISFGGTLRREE